MAAELCLNLRTAEVTVYSRREVFTMSRCLWGALDRLTRVECSRNWSIDSQHNGEKRTPLGERPNGLYTGRTDHVDFESVGQPAVRPGEITTR